MSGEAPGHKRRKRYRGTHPRFFSEKYKEHDPERYAKDVERVIARGDTPAGSHRSIMVKEILEVLAPQPGETAVDATLGYGGHARAILPALMPGGRLVGLDRDAAELARTEARIKSMGFPQGAFMAIHANFSELLPSLEAAGIGGADLILADLGLSSMQIDDPARGFSFKQRGPLDMRLDPSRGQSARDFLAAVDEERLRSILEANADEERAGPIAHAIRQRAGKLETTRDLAEAICSACPGLAYGEPDMTRILRRCFQAIRIEINGEFLALEGLLAALPSCLNRGGRVAFLAFHSGEDRRVEAAFAAGLAAGTYSSVSTEALRPGREERYSNPRSASAKLRWAIRA
jgi:16S rRNA (cytosine1402-N4)-methyltransferase